MITHKPSITDDPLFKCILLFISSLYTFAISGLMFAGVYFHSTSLIWMSLFVIFGLLMLYMALKLLVIAFGNENKLNEALNWFDSGGQDIVGFIIFILIAFFTGLIAICLTFIIRLFFPYRGYRRY